MKKTVWIIVDEHEKYVGIHPHETGAKHHVFQRQKYFKTSVMTIKKCLIEEVNPSHN